MGLQVLLPLVLLFFLPRNDAKTDFGKRAVANEKEA